MQLKPVTLKSRDEICRILETEQRQSSELTYLTMYIWQQALDIQYAILHDCVTFQLGIGKKSVRYPMGAGDKQAALDEIFAHYGDDIIFYGLEEKHIPLLGGDFIVSPLPEYADYVYLTKDLISLSGKKYHSKKNHLNMFKKSYNYKHEPMTADNALQCIPAYNSWYTNDDNDKFLEFEKQSIGNLLNNFEELQYQGSVLYADGDICAFTMSEQLNCDTAVIHIEKANTEIRGAYTAINQMHLEHTWQHLRFVNREEDLGLEGLMKAKMSYRPCHRVEKFKAVKKPL